MKVQKQTLDFDEEEVNIEIGLARLAKPIPDYELFYHINKLNEFSFSRTEDILIHGKYYDFYFSKFEAYHQENKTCIKFISNKSIFSEKKIEPTELFVDEDDRKFLLNNYKDVDYIITSSDSFPNFSLLLLPENIMFGIQNFSLSPDEELYNVIQYYE